METIFTFIAEHKKQEYQRTNEESDSSLKDSQDVQSEDSVETFFGETDDI